MDLLEMFSKNEDGFEILDSSYDPEFVAKIKEREKGLKGDKLVNVMPDDLWGSISTGI